MQLLGVSRSGFYAWRARRGSGPGPRAVLGEKIIAYHDALDGVNGAPRIVADLRAGGEVVSQKTVAQLMRDNGIAGISPRGWRPVTTVTDQDRHAIPDLVERRFDRGELNVVWTSDITYLATDRGLVVPVCGPRRVLAAGHRVRVLRESAHRSGGDSGA